ncbi:NADH dehydrogenase [ubiquinone] 1 beta subcomplex subunit 8, mitochondrial isoform X1 [Manihot esculenta]|uniref:NADH dehydrogenase [ubiquinone] 1 beta subcomplex subunit 8, mitochondrial isoform X1 n=2 Tax=Manihot esculenta TaxID=3983 RepID=UPI001CC6AC36|nr:NADH dehydrogenase [ubiquinone] 1 beta subcomplex subunit 8, mitochondrial isoform X1 [Manihot esculenta]
MVAKLEFERQPAEIISGKGVIGYREDAEDLRKKPRNRVMAGRLSNVASRIMGGNGVVGRSVAASLRLRSGMGLPVGKHIVPEKPLPVNDELVWDNGTPFPEPCIDRIADTVGKYEALAWMCGGLGFFATLGLLAAWNDKASKIPYDSVISMYFLESLEDLKGNSLKGATANSV